jgi:alpha,alpha-trehalase
MRIVQGLKISDMKNLDYGVIGNCMSAALISKEGWVDWCCLPEFNSPSVFARLLDKTQGGTFGFECGPGYTIEQAYIESTNILVTTYKNGKDSFKVIDFMPRLPF